MRGLLVLIPLDGSTIVSSFKQYLSNFTFIPQPRIGDITARLDQLADLAVSRSRKTDAAIWLWDYFLNRTLNSITTNTRGYHKLSAYFKDYAHYENVLFSIDENHRDHVIHSIWVMMIGFYLSKQCHPLEHLSYGAFQPVYLVGDLNIQPDSMKEALKIFRSNENALWMLISLTHDLGYPIQKTTAANDVMSKMISNFGFLTQTRFSYQFTVLHQTPIDELLNTLSTIILWGEGKHGNYRLAIDPGMRLDYSKTFEQLDHGIMSAYLLQRYLDFICENMSWLRDLPDYTENDTQTAALRALIISWLSSISDHTAATRYFKNLDDISVLLIISDELDEFSRYAHHRTRDTWISIECKPSINCTKHSLDFMYKFEIRNMTPNETLSFFKGKICRLIDCVDLNENSIRKLSIKCINYSSIPHNNVTYYFERRFDSGYGFVKKSYGGSTHDVIAFLNAYVNLD